MEAKKYGKSKDVKLPFEKLILNEDELFFIRGGSGSSNSGSCDMAGCGCGCESGLGCGCGCNCCSGTTTAC